MEYKRYCIECGKEKIYNSLESFIQIKIVFCVEVVQEK